MFFFRSTFSLALQTFAPLVGQKGKNPSVCTLLAIIVWKGLLETNMLKQTRSSAARMKMVKSQRNISIFCFFRLSKDLKGSETAIQVGQWKSYRLCCMSECWRLVSFQQVDWTATNTQHTAGLAQALTLLLCLLLYVWTVYRGGGAGTFVVRSHSSIPKSFLNILARNVCYTCSWLLTNTGHRYH